MYKAVSEAAWKIVAYQNLKWRIVAITQGKDKSYARFHWDHAEPEVPHHVLLKDELRTVEFYVTKEKRGKKALFSLTEIEPQNME